MSKYLQEVSQQPQQLRHLLGQYTSIARDDSFNFASSNILLIGMGASFHVAQMMAYRLQSQGKRADAIEATDFLTINMQVISPDTQVIYISQSGSSAEVLPAREKLQRTFDLAVTNNPQSPLAQNAHIACDVMAGHEETVATKTYLNSLALLYLLSGGDPIQLETMIEHIEQLLQHRDEIASHWMTKFQDAKFLYFLGEGMQAITAKQTAMMTSEWSKFPANHASIGAFRHGFIESADKDMGIVIFVGATNQDTAFRLANRLEGYGVKMLLVREGSVLNTESQSHTPTLFGGLLSSMLDTVAAQLFVQAFTVHRNIVPRFRYIQKVVDAL